MEEETVFTSMIEKSLRDPLNALIDEFKFLPSFSPVTKFEFLFVPTVTSITCVKVILHLIVYGGSIKWYVEYLDLPNLHINLEVQKFREFLIRLDAYLGIPFDRLPLYVPLPKEIPQYNTINNLIMCRLRLGV